MLKALMVVVLAATLLLSATAAQAATAQKKQKKAPTPAQEKAKAAAEVRTFLKKYAEAYNRKDLAAVLASFAKDKDMINVGTAEGEVWKGHDAIKDAFDKFFSSPVGVNISFDKTTVDSQGKTAWIYAEGPAKIKTGKDETQMRFRLTAVLENRQGKWLIVQSHSSVGSKE